MRQLHRLCLLKLLADFDLLCECDTHLNNGLRPPSAYTVVVRLPTTATLLVFFCIFVFRFCFCGYFVVFL